jgi:hypothetical protein
MQAQTNHDLSHQLVQRCWHLEVGGYNLLLPENKSPSSQMVLFIN